MPFYTITFKAPDGKLLTRHNGSWVSTADAERYASSCSMKFNPRTGWVAFPTGTTHTIKENPEAQRRYDLKRLWAEKWRAARKNMPASTKYTKSGQATALCMILGYKIYSDKHPDPKDPTKTTGGHNMAGNTIYNNTGRGSIPKNPKAREALEKLAGPYGAVLAKGWFDQRGIKWKYYPALGI